jgi:hypothetical protein
VIKKGQLRRWKNPDVGGNFVTVGYEILYGEDRRVELGWGGARRGRKVWKILEDGSIHTANHSDIESHSEVIE